MGYWELGSDAYRLADVKLAMRGEHQAANAAVAIATLRQLQRLGWNLPESAIRQGLAQASCPARVEIFRGPPLVVIDAAHNVASVEALMRVLDNEFRGKTGRLIFAASADKEVEEMLARLAPRFQSLYLTRFVVNPRSVPPAQLAGLVTQLQERTPWRRGSPGLARPTVWDNPLEAWRQAVAATRDDEFICIAGSFFLAAELRPVVARETAVN
jgi:dihydrofolate synthase/folylpolyglutamate synthase